MHPYIHIYKHKNKKNLSVKESRLKKPMHKTIFHAKINE